MSRLKLTRWFAAVVVAMLASQLSAASTAPTVRCTTWNLEWFPNGSSHDTSPEEQNHRITDAASVLKRLHPDILLLQEVRDYDACSRLGDAIELGSYHVEICSAFKEPFQSGVGRQQVAILSRFPAQAAWAEQWKSVEGIDPPRGFAFAWFKIQNADIGVYSLHLKSNLVTGGDRQAATAKNIRKREVAVDQLMLHVRDMIGAKIPTITRLIVGGDFNTNQDQAMFASEKTLSFLMSQGFRNSFEGLPLSQRVTHPANHGYPDATFDYLFEKNFKAAKAFATPTDVSDHWPVTCDFEIE
ncbi:MAG TPA: endonuclease/exonuclease/phosphatase family protein [Candidatus Udaeobacter sp.]|nr:endonuclease/exonuclease/phosphatase family protein [Candidatus Udaeobacter sp.]